MKRRSNSDNDKTKSNNSLIDLIDQSRECCDFNGSATQLLDDLSRDANVPIDGLLEKMLYVDEVLSDSDDEEDLEDLDNLQQEEESRLLNRTSCRPEYHGSTLQLLNNLARDAGTRVDTLVEKMVTVNDLLSDTDNSDDEEDEYFALEQELLNKEEEDEALQQDGSILTFLEESYKEQRRCVTPLDINMLQADLRRTLSRNYDSEDDTLSQDDTEVFNLPDILQQQWQEVSSSSKVETPWSSVHSKTLKNSHSSNSLSALNMDNRRSVMNVAA